MSAGGMDADRTTPASDIAARIIAALKRYGSPMTVALLLAAIPGAKPREISSAVHGLRRARLIASSSGGPQDAWELTAKVKRAGDARL